MCRGHFVCSIHTKTFYAYTHTHTHTSETRQTYRNVIPNKANGALIHAFCWKAENGVRREATENRKNKIFPNMSRKRWNFCTNWNLREELNYRPLIELDSEEIERERKKNFSEPASLQTTPKDKWLEEWKKSKVSNAVLAITFFSSSKRRKFRRKSLKN